MTQKHHQEEISGPLDTIEAAPLAKDLPRPKRARIQSRKARENQAQNQPFEVLSSESTAAAAQSTHVQNSPILSSSHSNEKLRQLSSSQNSSKRVNTNSQSREKKEEWQYQVESTRNKSEKLQILREVIGPPRLYSQKLNVPKPSAPGRVLLPPHKCMPIDLIYRFIPKELFTQIAEHTNEYTFDEQSKEFGQNQRVWRDVIAADIRGYIGAILLIGVQSGGRDVPYYWNQNNNQPTWLVAEYISQQRFQQITRYLKINRPGPIADHQWYQKVEPLATRFREATTKEIYQLSQDLSIDEQLISFKGRSKHTIQMNTKAAGEGYKIYSLCCSNGYMIDFKFSSAIKKVAELRDYSDFSQSEAVVLDFAHSLLIRFPRSKPFYILHLNNFFTTRKLYQELYELGISANGTAKAGSGIPKELAYLRDVMTKQNDHREWFNWVVGNVNCIAFCDSASKAMMTTVYDPLVDEYAYFDAIKRCGASLKYAKFAESLDAANSVSSASSTLSAPSAPSAPSSPSSPSANSANSANSKNSTSSALPANSTLPAPCAPCAPSAPSLRPFLRKLYPLDRYNKEMGGSDNHAKLNSYYTTSRHHHRRNWFPLFFFLIDAAVTNAYILYELANEDREDRNGRRIQILSHAEFQEEIAKNLLRGPGAILRQRRPRPPQKSSAPQAKSVRKGSYKGHS